MACELANEASIYKGLRILLRQKHSPKTPFSKPYMSRGTPDYHSKGNFPYHFPSKQHRKKIKKSIIKHGIFMTYMEHIRFHQTREKTKETNRAPQRGMIAFLNQPFPSRSPYLQALRDFFRSDSRWLRHLTNRDPPTGKDLRKTKKRTPSGSDKVLNVIHYYLVVTSARF